MPVTTMYVVAAARTRARIGGPATRHGVEPEPQRGPEQRDDRQQVGQDREVAEEVDQRDRDVTTSLVAPLIERAACAMIAAAMRTDAAARSTESNNAQAGVRVIASP